MKKTQYFFVGALLTTTSIFSDVYQWTGTTSNDMTDGSNWDPAGPPGENDTALFIAEAEPFVNSGEFDVATMLFQASGVEISVSGAGLVLDPNDDGDGIENDSNVTTNFIISNGGYFTLSGGSLATDGVSNYFLDNSLLDLQVASSSNANVILQNTSTLDVEADTTIAALFSLSSLDSIILTGNLTVDSPINTEIEGSLSGAGNFIKRGSGILTLTGVNTSTGTITASGGILVINGSAVAPVNVDSGAALAGNGTVGSVDFSSGSFFQVQINPTEAPFLNVMGTATLAGNVEVVQDPGSYARQGEYLILESAAIDGAFDGTVLGGSRGYIFSLTQVDNSVYLLYEGQFIPTAGLSGNALKVANYLNDYAETSTLQLLSPLSGDTLSRALDSISPSRNAFGTYITDQVMFSLSNLLTTHLDKDKIVREASAKKDFIARLLVDASGKVLTSKKQRSDRMFSGWISGFGEFAHQKGESQNPPFNFTSEAIVAGLDCYATKRALVGGALGYAHTHFSGDGNINYYFASAYANIPIDRFYLSPAVWGVFNQIDNKRKISFPGFSQSAKADIFAWQLLPHLEAGYEVKYSWGGLTPFTSADWAISWQRGYTEKGASPFNATQKATSSSMVRSETGLKFYEKWQQSWGIFFLKEKLSYVFEKPFGVGVVDTALTGIPNAFTVTAVNSNLNLAVLGLDFVAALGRDQSWLIDFSYNGKIGSSYWSNDLTFSLTKHF